MQSICGAVCALAIFGDIIASHDICSGLPRAVSLLTFVLITKPSISTQVYKLIGCAVPSNHTKLHLNGNQRRFWWLWSFSHVLRRWIISRLDFYNIVTSVNTDLVQCTRIICVRVLSERKSCDFRKYRWNKKGPSQLGKPSVQVPPITELDTSDLYIQVHVQDRAINSTAS